MENKLISIVIPCYNSGTFLLEAIESVKLSNGKVNYDIIIVDDGSTDTNTLDLLNKINEENIKIIHQQNRGPASARNTGVRESYSKYILFLDSDNKIRPDFINSAIKILENKPDVDIVYGKPSFFGDASRGFFETASFNLDKILFENYIDMCSVIRRSLWDLLGGLDENKAIIGHEDWEFWIRAGIANRKFYFIKEVVFDYRIVSNSLVTRAVSFDKFHETFSYVYGKHYSFLRNKLKFYSDDKNAPLRTFIKNLYHKYLKNN